MEKFIPKFILCLIFVTPLFFLPFTQEYFESPKAYLISLAGLAIFVLALISYEDFFKHIKDWVNTILGQLVIVLIIIQTITSFFGLDFATSFWGSHNQKNGLLFMFSLTFISIVISYLLKKNQLKHESIFLVLLYSILVSSILGIFKFLVQKVGIVNFEGLFFDGREVSTFGQPNFFGFFIAISVLFTPYVKTLNKKVIFYVILLMAEILSASKSGWALFCMNSIVLLVQNRSYNVSKQYVLYFVGAFLIFLNIGLLFTKTNNYKTFVNSDRSYQYRRITSVYTTPTTAEQDRITILKASIEASKQRLLIGYGKGHIDSALYPLIVNTSVGQKGIVDSSHNLFLDTLLESGLFALLILIGVFVFIIKAFAKERSYTKLFIFLGILLNGFFHNTSNVVWMLIAVMVAISATSENKT